MVEKERCKDMRWGRTMCKVYFSKKFRLERGKNKSEQKRGEIVAGLYWTYVHMTGARQPRMFGVHCSVGCDFLKSVNGLWLKYKI